MQTSHHPKFPLALEKRPKIYVDTQTAISWKQQAQIEITAVLGNRNSWYYNGKDTKELAALQLAFTKRDVRGFAADLAPGKCEFFCQGVLNVSPDDVAYALYCDETSDQRTLAAHMYQENFLDAAVLGVFERRTTGDPFRFAGVKWLAYEIPPGLVAASELVYFEFSCKTQDADGQVVLVQYIMCPEFAPEQLEEHNVGLARAHVSQISTFRVLEEGTHCQTVGWFESSPRVPAWVAAKAVQQQVFRNMERLVGLVDARAIARLGTATSVSVSKACYLCAKKFGLLHKRRNCRACGQSVCGKCTIKLKVLSEPAEQRLDQASHKQRDSASSSSNSTSTPRFVDDQFCLPCVLHAREHRRESGSLLDDGGRSLSSKATMLSSFLDGEQSGINLSDLHDAIDELDAVGALNHPSNQDRRQVSTTGARGRADTKATEDTTGTTLSQKPHVSAGLEVYVSQATRNGEKLISRKQGKRTPTYPLAIAEAEQENRRREHRHSPRRYGKRAASHDKTRQSQRRLPSRVDELGATLGVAEQPHSAASARSRCPHQQTLVAPSALEEKAPAPGQHQPPQPAMTLPEAFRHLAQSLAAQEALLAKIQHERQRLHSRRRQSSELADPVNDERLNNTYFEVVSKAL